jgi:hypothetical protein
LRARQKLSVGNQRAGQWISREEHPGARAIVQVAEHHRLHGDRGRQIVGQALVLAVRPRAARTTRFEDRDDRAAKLIAGVVQYSDAEGSYCLFS